MLIDDLLSIMAITSVPNPYNSEERVLNRNIADSTIDDFKDKIEIANDLLKIIRRFKN